MYCIDTEALVFMFNGGSPYGINNEKHVHHGFLAPRPYLCSTSLRTKQINQVNLGSMIRANIIARWCFYDLNSLYKSYKQWHALRSLISSTSAETI